MGVIFDGTYGEQVAPLAYHMNWPSAADSFYIANPTENTARRTYYSVGYVPTFRFDGKRYTSCDQNDFATWDDWYAWCRNTIDSLAAIPSPIRINLAMDEMPPETPDSVRVHVDIIAEADVHGTLKLRGAINESFRRMGAPAVYHYIFRDMFPTTTGEALPDMLAGDSLHYDYVIPFDNREGCLGWNPDRVIATVWVQDDTTGANAKRVLNSATQCAPLISTDVAVGEVPLRVVLDQNAPNPFNPETSIGFVLDKDGKVRLSVFAPTGRLVTDLVNGSVLKGSHTVRWDGRDRLGRDVGSGVYYYRLDAESTSLTRKMILIR